MNTTISFKEGNTLDPAIIAIIIIVGFLFLSMIYKYIQSLSSITECFEPCQGERLEENLETLKIIGHFLANPCSACIEDIHNNAPPENRVVAQYKLVI